MNSSSYGIKGEQNLKKSLIMQPYLSQNISSNSNRSSLLKRSSFTLNQAQYSTPIIDYPNTPKAAMTIRMENNYNPSSYHHHQSNYASIPYQSIQAPLQQISANRIEAFSLESKKYKEPSIQDIVKQISQKLDKTVHQVQRHQDILKTIQNNPYSIPNIQSQSLGKIIMETVNDQMKIKEIQNNLHYNFVKTQIESLRDQIYKFIEKGEVQERIKFIGENINKAIENVNKDLMGHLIQMSESQTKSRKKEIEKISQALEQKFINLERSLDEKIKRQKDESDQLTESSSMETIPTRKVFLGDPLLLKFITKVAITLKSNTKQIQETQTVYKMDNEGYLLDNEGRYILNSKYEQIKLSTEQTQLIREHGFLK